MENLNPKPKNTTCNFTDIPNGKPSFVSVVHGSTKSSANTSQPVKHRTVSLIDQDLIRIDDATRVLLVKLKDIESMSNMYHICKNEGFVDIKIHHIGGLWIWIQFPTSDACVTFQSKESLKRYYSSYKVYISTKTHKFISEKVDVEIHGEIFEVNVHELGTWSINIVDENDNSQDLASSEDENELEKVADTFDDNLADDIKDIIKDLAVDNDKEVALEKSPEDANGDLEFPLNESGSPDSQSKKEEKSGKDILFGDMNEVRSEQERRGSIFSRNEADVFNSFINNTGLIDLPMGGHMFMWTNKFGSKLSKLDRFLIFEEECGSDKAPGSDGFSFAFVKRYWEILKLDILEFVSTFISSKTMPTGSNSSFITLIPKVSNPVNIKDFQPISLIGIHYKIIAKLLANKLSKVVGKVVSHEQSAFIKDHQILDGPLILSEHFFECGPRSISRVSGSLTFEFNVRRGLRQGDPIYPFLFIIIMEGLHGILTDSVQSGLIRASGLKLNVYKSGIYGIGVSNDDVHLMASNIRCVAGTLPFTYLGLPIGCNMSLIENWKSLIDKFKAKLSAHLNELLVEIIHLNVQADVDKCIWSLDNDGVFTVGAIRRLIDDHLLPSLGFLTTWDKDLPRKVNIFMWRLKLDKLPHHLNVSLRGIEIPEIFCP
nr:RNA-directed DNA polymerase, eukaryota, reverse transcriptase zinc-binding domain protein [Tanacetum cinerariifolium]GEY33101.1 RNA-directed DNA polymerase, eukaryota, reverse transcriptase zinc-binding domain protein [Tanacetum cinerariifolium]